MDDLAADRIHLWFGRLSEVDRLLPDPAALLDPDECGRADRFVHAVHRRRFVARRALLRSVAARYTDSEPSELVFDRTCTRCGDPSHGKPRLARFPSLHVSVSSSDNLALFGFALTDVGVDVERLDRDFQVNEVAGLALGSGEHAALARVPVARRGPALLAAWVQKESVLKAAGAGLADAPASVRVAIDPEPPPAAPAYRWARTGGVMLLTFSLEERYVGCAALQTRRGVDQVRWFRL
jgi:4'-phosphopantetheinyl transferase